MLEKNDTLKQRKINDMFVRKPKEAAQPIDVSLDLSIFRRGATDVVDMS